MYLPHFMSKVLLSSYLHLLLCLSGSVGCQILPRIQPPPLVDPLLFGWYCTASALVLSLLTCLHSCCTHLFSWLLHSTHTSTSTTCCVTTDDRARFVGWLLCFTSALTSFSCHVLTFHDCTCFVWLVVMSCQHLSLCLYLHPSLPLIMPTLFGWLLYSPSTLNFSPLCLLLCPLCLIGYYTCSISALASTSCCVFVSHCARFIWLVVTIGKYLGLCLSLLPTKKGWKSSCQYQLTKQVSILSILCP